MLSHVYRHTTEESGGCGDVFRRAPSHNDYYSQAETEYGHWIGTGAEQLGLQPGDVVSRETFLKLCDNQHPETGEQLTPQQFRERRIFSTSCVRRPNRFRFWRSQ